MTMLKIPAKICENEKINTIIKSTINNFLIAMVECEYELTTDKSAATIQEIDSETDELLSILFPKKYPVSNCGMNFIALYNILKSNKEEVPELVQEYVLASIITSYINTNEDLMKAAPNLAYNPLKIEYPKKDEILKGLKDDTNYSELNESAENILSYYEDIHNLLEICFWDFDYALLDTAYSDSLASTIRKGIEDSEGSKTIFFHAGTIDN